MENPLAAIKGGVVLAELGGHGNGPYCARHGKGAAMVVMGTYVVDAGPSVPYPADFVFGPDPDAYADYLTEHVTAARESGAKVAVSVISVELADSIAFLQAAETAGADCASLCAYSAMSMFTSVGLGMALCRPDNRDRLSQWSGALSGSLSIPVIIKMGMGRPADTIGAVETMADHGIAGVHVAFGDASGTQGLSDVQGLAKACPFLIAGGGIVDVAGARRLLDAGADAVAIAGAAMQDPDLCGRIQAELMGKP